MRRLGIIVTSLVVGVLAGPTAAYACGSLVGPNGAVQLVRTTTLAAHHNGVEHYITNFEFNSNQESFGSIIPLPGEPTKVERGGDWTLQRLRQEVAPPAPEGLAGGDASTSAAEGVEVLSETRIDSLDVTILRGGGEEVAEWAAAQGCSLTPDTPDVLEFYSRRSPFFMAAKFDATAALAQGFTGGDGIPVHLTIPLDSPWVPLKILGTGKPADEIVQADVFLLTDQVPELLAGRGVDLERSEAASTALLDDLRSDAGMEWVPDQAWLSHLVLNEAVGDLDYDLATSVSFAPPEIRDAGLPVPDELVDPAKDEGWSWTATFAVVAAVALVVGVGTAMFRRPASR